MEMHSIQMDNIVEAIEDESTPCSPDLGDIFGEPQELPRIGVRYQAEIPSLIVECDQLQVINKPTDSEVVINLPESFSLGLPIPIMWANCELENINRTVDFENRKACQITSNGADSKLDVELPATSLCDGKSLEKISGLQPVGSDSMEVDLILSVEFKNKLDQVERGFCPLPGSRGESWTDIECDSFLLGLYIFGKNLILVKRFVESKEMGDMLSFYHGKFYGSDRYRRWSECRKLRSRRCIYGQKIFTGWRQQELLSRLSSHVSEECQHKLLEVSRTFGRGNFSFEEYIFTLKDTVGINMLIEAVGIGKGKQDLTGPAMEPIKTNHVLFLHPEIPIGKACSSLTSADIIKLLRGNFRLSKARSSDLFWEAVWPLLLARGWHSEQPNDHGVSGSKHSLVFLIPGVKKFSRRLVKGNHYFDSVSDVLNIVASDPGLLELDIEAGEGSGHKEDKWEPLRKQTVDGLSNKQHHCYLQPRTSNCNQDIVKFTIVDTSMVHETELPKVRELRSLPVQTTSLSTPSSLSCETEQDTTEESEEINTSNQAGDMTEMEASVDSSDCAGVLNVMDPIIAAVEDHKSPNTSLLKENCQGKAMKHHFGKKMNSSHSENLAPVMKQKALNANCGESSHSIGVISAERKQNEAESHCQSTFPSACHDMAFRVGPQNLSSDSSLAKRSREGSNAASITENCLGGEVSPGKPQPWTFMDLNLPYASPDIGTEEPFIMDMMQINDNSCANKLSFPSETSQLPEPSKISDSGASTEQQPTMNSRRQSVRSRPLTTKVWEALEYGLFDRNRKRKRVETSHNSISRSSRQSRGKAALSSTLDNGASNDIVDTMMEVNLDEVCSSKVNAAGESQV